MYFDPILPIHTILKIDEKYWEKADKKIHKIVMPLIVNWTRYIIVTQKWHLKNTLNKDILLVLHTFVLYEFENRPELHIPVFIWLRLHYSFVVLQYIEEFLEGARIISEPNIELN